MTLGRLVSKVITYDRSVHVEHPLFNHAGIFFQVLLQRICFVCHGQMLICFVAVSYFTNVCQYAMMCGLITSPVAGIIYDIHKRIFARE